MVQTAIAGTIQVAYDDEALGITAACEYEFTVFPDGDWYGNWKGSQHGHPGVTKGLLEAITDAVAKWNNTKRDEEGNPMVPRSTGAGGGKKDGTIAHR